MAEIRWDSSFYPIAMVKSVEAAVAVAGERDPDLDAVPIAWDGIAVVVDFTNPVKGLTAQQVAAMFSGTVTRWSDLGGTDNRIELIDRPSNQHIRGTFETVLGIVGKIPLSAQVRRSDQRAISSVAGNGAAVTYASLGVVLDAVMYGVGVSPLLIDGVKPANQTVKDGRYRLRRPVLLLRKPGANPIADSFAEFAKNSKSANLQREAAKALLKASFLKDHKQELIVEMKREDIGTKDYHISKFLNEKFFETLNPLLAGGHSRAVSLTGVEK